MLVRVQCEYMCCRACVSLWVGVWIYAGPYMCACIRACVLPCVRACVALSVNGDDVPAVTDTVDDKSAFVVKQLGPEINVQLA